MFLILLFVLCLIACIQSIKKNGWSFNIIIQEFKPFIGCVLMVFFALMVMMGTYSFDLAVGRTENRFNPITQLSYEITIMLGVIFVTFYLGWWSLKGLFKKRVD